MKMHLCVWLCVCVCMTLSVCACDETSVQKYKTGVVAILPIKQWPISQLGLATVSVTMKKKSSYQLPLARPCHVFRERAMSSEVGLSPASNQTKWFSRYLAAIQLINTFALNLSSGAGLVNGLLSNGNFKLKNKEENFPTYGMPPQNPPASTWLFDPQRPLHRIDQTPALIPSNLLFKQSH